MTETQTLPLAHVAMNDIENYDPHWFANGTGVLDRIAGLMLERGAHPSRTFVLLPYAQLLRQARQMWAARFPNGFAPRFETSKNWSQSIAVFAPGAGDIAFDTAVDTLTAQSLIQSQRYAEHHGALAQLLVEAAHQLGPLAAAFPPEKRAEWTQNARSASSLGLEAASMAFERIALRSAVEWAGVSAYATDVLFTPHAMAQADLLIVLTGLSQDPMASGLQEVWGERMVQIPLAAYPAPASPVFHACLDAQDEAQHAAACVVTHICAGRFPLALVSSDRALTRRVQAMLEGAGAQIRDETGWKLSTSHAGAGVMALLKAVSWNASSDAVLAWLKLTSGWVADVDGLESQLRRQQIRDWRNAQRTPCQDAIAVVNTVRDSFQGSRRLGQWLAVLRTALEGCGMWEALAQDGAGAKVIAALRLEPSAPWQTLLGSALWAGQTLDLAAFTQWVQQSLEDASFTPPYPAKEQVVVLPMSQMLARPFKALVIVGCDEVRLPASPESSGPWTPAQRVALGLPSRETLEAAHRLAWAHALSNPWCDVLWRESDDAGEALLPSPLVQTVMGSQARKPNPELRTRRSVAAAPVTPPSPTAAALSVNKLSQSAYEDLRHCPYRFFALRQLGLRGVDELDAEIDKRDFGLWLHHVLQEFHLALQKLERADLSVRRSMLNAASEKASHAMGLDAGEFLPFAASWPRVREGYLHWLTKHEAQGRVFKSAENECRQSVADWLLEGRIDRIDTLSDGTLMVLDYKTEPEAKTKKRVSNPLEDTQMAFYAALLPQDTVAGAYVNISEKETKDAEQKEVVQARDALIEGLVSDMQRIGAGAPMPALGEASACEFCNARGLCRKDFWAPV